MSLKQELLGSFDDAWSHRWESFEANLKNITEEEAAYQSPLYSNEPIDPSMPPIGSILWHLVHLCQCYMHYNQSIISRPQQPIEPEPPQVTSYGEAVKYLQQIRGEFRTTINTLTDADFDELIYSGDTVGVFIRTDIRHEIWHIAQMAVARRMYRMSTVSKYSS